MTSGALARVETELPGLPEALRRVGEVILGDPAEAARSTIIALAERAGSSPATVTRFCRAFGFSGYAELRVALATETGRAAQAGWGAGVGHEIGPDDPLDAAIEVMAAADTRLIQDTAAGLDLDVLARVADAIVAAPRVLLVGVSTSGIVANMLEGWLRRIGISGWSAGDAHVALSEAALLKAGDVAIGISHRGRTREVMETLAEAGSHGALTVAVTSFARSPLAELADLVLTTASRETTFRLGGLAAVHSQLFVLDAVYVAVAQRTYERTNEAFERTISAVESHRVERSP
ncbi:MurR/RpiR family transcriptional regulator [Nonomuraea gerenzanensis]|uniref:Transcriptional regulator, RpiR family n=1 Tax=Nonomuraea gerenzanensis TaxID=93944 RepID=A0A1M4E389_9ACTN|nr:MurR/RpiR family transcriptional regulator [Nonomuraea gerenzanensis]UBU15507.1 MurR/RpiR family transcriptional regulator [Nonomuraea gerenzanensis]SBO93269.1 transcriptional regulator, RpiR family [Nonomuraea gerenzanensis]